MNEVVDRRPAGANSRPKGFGWLRRIMLTVVAVASTVGFDAGVHAADLQKSGTVHIEQYQVAFIGSGNLGGGTLSYNGKSYKFTIGGLGIGGFGVSKITAAGAVYNMKDLSDFAGAYGQARTGFAVADQGGGTLWLENEKGVYMKLASTREGLALSLGADAVYIEFD